MKFISPIDIANRRGYIVILLRFRRTLNCLLFQVNLELRLMDQHQTRSKGKRSKLFRISIQY